MWLYFVWCSLLRRAFSVAGLWLWNSLPDGLRDPDLGRDSFRRLLKTHFFTLYWNISRNWKRFRTIRSTNWLTYVVTYCMYGCSIRIRFSVFRLVVMHTYLYYFPLWLSHCRLYNVRQTNKKLQLKYRTSILLSNIYLFWSILNTAVPPFLHPPVHIWFTSLLVSLLSEAVVAQADLSCTTELVGSTSGPLGLPFSFVCTFGFRIFFSFILAAVFRVT